MRKISKRILSLMLMLTMVVTLLSQMSLVVEAGTGYDEAAYNEACTEWENNEPQLATYGLKTIVVNNADVIVLSDAVDRYEALTLNLNDGYTKIDGEYYKEATVSEAYEPCTLKTGYAMTEDGVFYNTQVAADADAYTITDEVYNEGYGKIGDTYIEIVDESEATQEKEGVMTTTDEDGDTVYYYEDEFTSVTIAVTGGYFKAGYKWIWVNDEQCFYNEDEPKVTNITLDRVTHRGYDNTDEYCLVKKGLDIYDVYYRVPFEEAYYPDTINPGYVKGNNGLYYVAHDEPVLELISGYYLDEASNIYYTTATYEEAVDTPTITTLNSGYIEIEETPHEIVTEMEACVINDGYVEKNGNPYTESDEETATTASLNSGYYSVTEENTTSYYKEAVESDSEYIDYTKAMNQWTADKPDKLYYAYPTYIWKWSAADKNYTCTATRVSPDDSTHSESETVICTSVKTPATCTTVGTATYTATFTNSAFSTQTKNVEIVATGHTLTKVAAKAATTTSTGNMEYYKCTVCGSLFLSSEGKTEISLSDVTIAKLQPDYGEITYSWSDDGKTCTAQRVCTNDSSATVTEEAKVTSKVTKAATCTAKGSTTYTATFKNTIFTTQTKALDINAKGHKLTKVAAKKATTTSTGNKAYYKCSTCGKLYLDSAGKTKTTLAKVTIAKLAKATNPMKLKAASKTLKYTSLKKKAVSYTITFSKKAQGKVTYTLSKAAKNAGIKVSSKGKITVPKNCKKGTYKITIKAAGNSKYKATSKTFTVVVK